jgi:multiple sugar transport system substrate-binding protein
VGAIPRRLLPCTAVTAALTLVGGCGLASSSVESAMTAKERGPITFATSDTSGIVPALIKRWNDKHPGEKATFIELPEDADAQRQQMIQNAQLKTDTYSVLNLDVVWTSEFASHGWIDQIPDSSFPFDKTLGPINDTANYRNKWFAMPYASDGALLYYRKDLLEKAGVKQPPKTWAEMRDICDKVLGKKKSKMSCYAGQFEKYEGLTVNFSEAINSAGGEVTDAKGVPHLDTPEAKRGMDNLVKSFKDGTIPKDGITFMEEQGRRAFEKGDLLFYRNWPYQYAISDKKAKNNEVAGKFGIAPIPGAKGPGASSLGGHNLALSSSSRNKATALDFMHFMTNEQSARLKLEKASLAPVFTNLYDEPQYVKKFPYLPVLKKSILGAEPRPRVVQYGDSTKAIQDASYNALTGKQSSAAALRGLQKQLRALAR